MHFQSTLGLLALVTTGSVHLAGASQALIHIEVNDMKIMDYDYFEESAPAAMSKAEADAVCAKGMLFNLLFQPFETISNLDCPDPAYGPNYQACMGGPNGAPSGCVCKPSACLQPCFGNYYTSPKDGSRGCCPLDQMFSFDAKSLEGACCSNGTAYKYDSDKKCGSCAPIYDECTKPYPGSVGVGDKNFINYSNRGA